MGISIRRAIISDIPGLNELLHQVHKVHADITHKCMHSIIDSHR